MRRAAFLAIAFSLAAAGCSRAQDAGGSAAARPSGAKAQYDEAFGAKVRAYLLDHPEVLEEMVESLNVKKSAAAETQLKDALRTQRAALERDPRDFVANPAGKITLTEFYDYRCSHCIASAPEVAEIIRQNPDVRVVFKELPIFGDVSEHAAIAAIAVKRAGGDYLAVWRDFMGAKPLDRAAIDRILRARNIDPAIVATHTAEARKQIADTEKLAQALRIEGTPAFVIGDMLVPGRDMDAVRQAISEARSKLKG